MREKPYSDCLILFSKRRKESITKIFSQKKLHPFPIKRWNKERTDSNSLTKNLPFFRKKKKEKTKGI